MILLNIYAIEYYSNILYFHFFKLFISIYCTYEIILNRSFNVISYICYPILFWDHHDFIYV